MAQASRKRAPPKVVCMHPPPGGFNITFLEAGAPQEGEIKNGWRVVKWAMGWIFAALSAIPANTRRHGALLLAGAALAQAEASEEARITDEARTPPLATQRRAQQWGLALRGLTAAELRNVLNLQDP